MGRGGHPGTFRERLDHLMTPWTRARFAHDALRTNAEMSFQGGDGFLYFETPALAAATIQSVFDWAFDAPAQDSSDAFYSDINFSWDAYRAIKGWQESLFASAHYQAPLSTFGPNLLPATGSRKVRRQSGASKDDIARSLRAIPHNAILQQLAAPANVLGGMGSAAAREPERFAALVALSPRMAQLFAMAFAARRLTSLSILRTYANLYSPSFWTIRAARSQSERDAELSILIADRLSQRSLDFDLDRLANILSSDRRHFDAARRDLDLPPDGASAFDADIGVLHALRMVMIIDGFTLAASTPGFSPRHELARETLIDLALDLRFADVADLVEEIFPASDAPPAAFSRLAEEAEPAPASAGYPEIRRDIAAPLRRIDRMIKEISVGVAHFYDAYG
jgi:phosphoenolpyruvate carboxylase